LIKEICVIQKSSHELSTFGGAFGITISWTKKVILNQITKSESFGIAFLKKLRFKNTEQLPFQIARNGMPFFFFFLKAQF
jgi:hypothetical protein